MTPAQIEEASRLLTSLNKAKEALGNFQRLAFSDAARKAANASPTSCVGIVTLTTVNGMQACDVPLDSVVLHSIEALYQHRVYQAEAACREAGVTL